MKQNQLSKIKDVIKPFPECIQTGPPEAALSLPSVLHPHGGDQIINGQQQSGHNQGEQAAHKNK